MSKRDGGGKCDILPVSNGLVFSGGFFRQTVAPSVSALTVNAEGADIEQRYRVIQQVFTTTYKH